MSERLLAKGVRVIGYTDMGARYIMNSQRAVKTPDDLRGLKMRVIQDPVPLETYAAMGARAIPMARPEVYSALKQGVLDGLDNSLAFYESMGDFEVAKHLTLGVQIFQTPGALMVSERFYQRLAKELQAAVIESAAETIPQQRQLFRQGDDAILTRLRAKGVAVETADPAPFQRLASPVWDKFQDRVGGRAAIDAVINAK
jgi:TRAP-type C4-dicarboxylate transport system substrate-binding protein